jgi:hypothetical protein
MIAYHEWYLRNEAASIHDPANLNREIISPLA